MLSSAFRRTIVSVRTISISRNVIRQPQPSAARAFSVLGPRFGGEPFFDTNLENL
jgi:hypothetical protein